MKNDSAMHGRRHDQGIAAGLRLLMISSLFLLGACQQMQTFEFPWSLGSGKSASESDTDQLPALVPASKIQVRHTQKLLTDLGYQPGPIDGVLGSRTRRAIAAYQRKRGLPIDGQVTEHLIANLDVSLRAQRIAAPNKTAPAQKSTASKPARKSQSAAPRLAALPAYRPGNTYVYSDGSVERVVSLKGDAVRWISKDGSRYSWHRNFTLPWSYWSTADERGTATLDREPGRLWPLVAGKAKAYSVKVVVQNQLDESQIQETTEVWRCVLVESATVAVMAGTFETSKIVCDGEGVGAARPKQRVWYYAPRIGHYVRYDEIFDNAAQNRLVELVAIQPAARDWPPIARTALDRAVQQALDELPDGKHKAWSSSGVEIRVTIKPTRRFERVDGTPCRSFLQTWSGPDGKRRYPAAACRAASGQWRIPGLEGLPEASLAIAGTTS